MSQPGLFDDDDGDDLSADRPGQMHLFGHDTEAEAAESIRSVSGQLRLRALALLRAAVDGLTDDEGGELMGGDRLTFGRRRHELVQAGRAYDSGQRRRTPTGRKAIVWKAKR